MIINIPCTHCGCQTCEAETTIGQIVQLEICRCNDGSNEFEISITPLQANSNPEYEKHQCSANEIAECLSSRFNINITSITHRCH